MAVASPVDSISGSARRRSVANTRRGPFEGNGSRAHQPCDNNLLWMKPHRLALAATLGGALFVYAFSNMRDLVEAGSSIPEQPLQEGGLAAAWPDTVAQCTGAAGLGFSYRPEAPPTKILRYSRRPCERQVLRDTRRRDEAGEINAGTDEAAGSESLAGVPSLEKVVRWVWNTKLVERVLWFTVSELETRRDVGEESGWECIFAANPGRSKPFPPPEPVQVSWDESQFNFYRADPLEFMFEYVPSFQHVPEAWPLGEEAESMMGDGRSIEGGKLDRTTGRRRLDGGLGGMLEAFSRGGVRGQGRDESDPRGAGRGLSGWPLSRGRFGDDYSKGVAGTGPLSVDCVEVSGSSPPQHAVLVNVRPVGPVSILLMPGYPQSLNQRARPEALAVAMDFSEALMSSPGFRLGFNSGGSSASVNHLHFQCWHFNAGPRGLPLEVAKTTYEGTLRLRTRTDWFESEEEAPESEGDLEVHVLDDSYPLRGLVYHTLGKDLEAVGVAIVKCIDYLLEMDIPHTMLFSQGRAYLLPRQHLQKPPFAAVIGFPEVSGEIIITSQEDFRTATADSVFRFWRESVTVDADRFEDIRRACLLP